MQTPTPTGFCEQRSFLEGGWGSPSEGMDQVQDVCSAHRVYELVLYSRAVSGAEVTAIESAMRTRWAR